MKIAVSEYDNNVAAAFDFAHGVIVFTCEKDVVVEREHIVLNEQFIPLRCMKLKNHGVDTVICGAISNPSAIMLRHHGIEVVSGITGTAETVIREFLKGTIDSPQYRLPGFGRRGCGRMQGRRYRRGFKGGRKKMK